MSKKPREFWIVPGKWYGFDELPESYSKPGSFPKIHVREVVPIDWDKVWNDLDHKEARDLNAVMNHRKLIQELVEKQITGEE